MPSAAPSILRWAARLSGLLIAGFFAFLFLGEFTAPRTGPPAGWREWTGISLLVAACAGMLLAWQRELFGALLSLTCIFALGWIIPFHDHTVLTVIAIPGVLYLLDYFVDYRIHHHAHP